MESIQVKGLKELIRESEGQLILLSDINEVREKLSEYKAKYHGIVVTRENYKEVAQYERTLRQIRYELQRVYNHNNSFINKAKKEYAELFDNLVEYIEPTEKRLAKEIKDIETAIKEEKERAEKEKKEREAKIIEELTAIEVKIERLVLTCDSPEKLHEYDKYASELENRTHEFYEYEFKAKRLHAIMIGRRSEAEENMKKAIQAEEALKKNPPKKESEIEVAWQNAKIQYESYGGDPKKYGNIPRNESEIKEITEETKRLFSEKYSQRSAEIENETAVYIDILKQLVLQWEKTVNNAAFKHTESRQKMGGIIEKLKAIL